MLPVKSNVPIGGLVYFGEFSRSWDFNPQGIQMIGGIMMNLPKEMFKNE